MRRRGATLLVVAGLLAPTLPAPAAGQWLDPGEPTFWAASGLLLGAAVALDGALARDNPDRAHPVRDVLSDVGYGLGGRTVLVPGFAAGLTVSHLTGWPAGSDRLLNAAMGVVAANVVTEGVKYAVGRGRPRHVDDPFTFRPFAGGGWKSFPSGHATTAFAAAAALSEEFELGWLEPAVWGLAGLVAWSRVYDDAHWTSDTVAGAIIGIAAGQATVAWLHRRAAERGEGGARLELGLRDGGALVAVRVGSR